MDLVFERFKDRFFLGEHVILDIHGDKFPAAVRKIHPSRSLTKRREQEVASTLTVKEDKLSSLKKEGQDSESELSDAPQSDNKDSASEPKLEVDEVAHVIGTDLNVDSKEAHKLDHPVDDYLYSVQLLSEDNDDDYSMALMERRADNLSRDRISFSKSILKKYLKECVMRDASIGSPWVVRPILAEVFGIPTQASNDVEEKNRLIKEGKLSKRRKYLDEEAEEGKAFKKRKQTKEEKARLEAEKKEEEERKKAEERKKKMIKYPIEDLQLDQLTQEEVDTANAKNSEDPPRRIARITPKKDLLPVEQADFEPLMNSYLFLQACGRALMLSPFTLDDYLAALNHRSHDPACHMIGEAHGSLLNVIVRDVSNAKIPTTTDVAVDSEEDEFDEERNAAEEEEEAADEEEEELDELDSKASSPAPSSEPSEPPSEGAHEGDDQSDEVEAVYATARKLGKGWERKMLRPDNYRDGWEYSLIGFLSKRATEENFPRILPVLSHLTGVGNYGSPSQPDESNSVADVYKTPVHRYPTLPLRDKILVLQFLCDEAVLTRTIKRFFDECETLLTELRKERVELNRARRKLIEDRAAFEEEHRKEKDDSEENTPQINGEGEKDDADVQQANGLSSAAHSDDESNGEEDELMSEAAESALSSGDEYDSEAANSTGTGDMSDDRPYRRKFGSRQEAMRVKALQREAEEAERNARLAQQRQEHKARLLETRQIALERKRFDDEESRIIRREEAIDREFRQHSQAPRVVPMGRDRFLDKYWWFDGVGAASIFNPQGQVQYSTGRLFVQGPSEEEWSALMDEVPADQTTLENRRKEELGLDGSLNPNEWAVYSEPEDIDALMAWFRTKGVREHALRQHLQRFRWYLQEGMQKRNHNLIGGWKDNVETRRSNRTKDNAANRQPYMNYRNSFAKGV